MKWILLAVVCGLIALAAVLLLQRPMLFPRYAARPFSSQPPDLPGLESWWLDTPQGRVEAFCIPGAGVSAQRPGPLALMAHGNAELIDYLPWDLKPYLAQGISLVLPEYRGYGRSAGSPSERAIRADLHALLLRALQRPEVDPARLVLHGRSLGGGAACALARDCAAAGDCAPAAMILQSSFTSVADMAWRTALVPRFLVLDPFDNLVALQELDCPTLVLHGRHDEIIPYAHGQALAQAAKQGRLVSYDAGHNDMPMDAGYWATVLGFLREAGVLDGEG